MDSPHVGGRDDQAAARCQHPRHLLDHQGRTRHVLEHLEGDDGPEAALPERQGEGVPPHVRRGCGEAAAVELEMEQIIPDGFQKRGERLFAAADVEDAAAGAAVDRLLDAAPVDAVDQPVHREG